jgi:phospholipid/cholesterol/gamma-HCH transport system ATP-binding protein
MNRAERVDRIAETLSWFGLVDKRTHFPSELSGGQKKRIALARAIVLEPEIMLYDEPTTGLDPESVRTVSELIVRLRDERGITSIAITHDILCAEIIADDAFFLHEGHFIASGTLEEIRNTDIAAVRNFYG